ncbi:probable cytochrome P450 6g2 [Teleopsis dalmanni]|uniref:probable cytochrome P450 6g2 n=1 Tax=Teleopsis dalmanni TaxID=139649 RepID=UPI0018CEC8C4|nr:probable cytochrome P450 6g2 [Teleopsis dalmanni]
MLPEVDTTIFLLLLTIGFFYYVLRFHYNYWVRKKVPQIKPTFFVGNMGNLIRMKNSSAEFIRDLYNHPQAKTEAFVGIHLFYNPAILLRDPELIKMILIRDFSKFCNRYSNSDLNGDPIGSKNIFFLKNPAWKDVRLKLTPFFTSGRMKHMFYLVDEVGRSLNDYLLSQSLQENESKLNSFVLELKEFCALYTTDVIATVAYGVQANTFKNPNGDFRRNGREVFRFSTKRALEFTVLFFLPHLMPFFGFKVVPKKSTEFIRSTINFVMEQRELSGKTRNDLIDILIEYKNWSKAQNEKKEKSNVLFEGDILVAQAAIFFTAGFETSSATMSFALYELSKRPLLQKRVRDEIRNALRESNGKVTQQLIDSLEYTQMVIYETLRLYPPLPFLDRECTIDANDTYTLDKITIKRGMPIYIPVYGLHMDPKFFPNPNTFDPERFSNENRKSIKSCTYLPFGQGPHACIGERFSMLQIKIGLVYFFLSHYVTTCSKTKSEMKLDPKAIILQAEGGIYLSVVRDPINA